ncbi:hypothetical protein Ahy_B02g057966 isoform G [Arachis hypogaea]|uniref:Uncharacterized protein n=1 Tax=Arachis hypogaea TaxID=3818 RepID=A0A445ADE8_ARAHY|nr:hypothetical protein Ahy_B02g057966 isoform G [Arachis hypogaea]
MRTWLRLNKRLAAISSASLKTKGKNFGYTQPQGDPGGVFVNGSEQVTIMQRNRINIKSCLFKLLKMKELVVSMSNCV